MKRLAVLAVAVVMVGCANSGPDGSAQRACEKFTTTARDARDGVITPAELRGRIQSVESDAKYSEEPGVATSARRMLATVTADDVDGYAAAVADFIAACNASVD